MHQNEQWYTKIIQCEHDTMGGILFFILVYAIISWEHTSANNLYAIVKVCREDSCEWTHETKTKPYVLSFNLRVQFLRTSRANVATHYGSDDPCNKHHEEQSVYNCCTCIVCKSGPLFFFNFCLFVFFPCFLNSFTAATWHATTNHESLTLSLTKNWTTQDHCIMLLCVYLNHYMPLKTLHAYILYVDTPWNLDSEAEKSSAVVAQGILFFCTVSYKDYFISAITFMSQIYWRQIRPYFFIF